MKYTIPYGSSRFNFEVPADSVIFTGETTDLPKLPSLKDAVLSALKNPISSPPFGELAAGRKNVLFLIEDGTRDTPLAEILPVIVNHLNEYGVPDEAMSFLTAPGTHRIMTDEEILRKIGSEMVERFSVYQHDATRCEDMVDMGTVSAGEYTIPVHINHRAIEADLLLSA